MQLRPLRVRRVDTVVDDRCPIACPLGVGRHGDVGADDLNAFRELGSSASNRGTYPVTSRREMTGHGETQRTRPQDDVQFRFVHPLDVNVLTSVVTQRRRATTPERARTPDRCTGTDGDE